MCIEGPSRSRIWIVKNSGKSEGRYMDKTQKMKLRAEAQQIKPAIRIGRNGLTTSVIEEIRSQLKARRLMKVLALRSYLSDNTMDDAASDINNSIHGVHVIDVRGHTIVLYK